MLANGAKRDSKQEEMKKEKKKKTAGNGSAL